MLSFLLGAVTLLFDTSTVVCRLVPFCLGVVSCYLWLKCVRILRGSVGVFALLIVATPLLLVGTNHLQTDGSVGLMGISVLGYLCLYELRRSRVAWSWFLCVGAWLAFSKTEIFAFGVIPTIVTGLLSGGWRRCAVLALAYIAGFVPAAVLIAGMSVMTFGDLRGLFEVYQTITRIVEPLIFSKIHSDHFGQALMPTSTIQQQLYLWNIPCFLVCGLFSTLAGLLPCRRDEQAPLYREALALIAFILPPTLSYLFVGYGGDGFPRYYLIVVPFCFIAVASCLRSPFWQKALPFIALGYVCSQQVQLRDIYSKESSFTGFRGQEGFERAGVTLREVLPPHTKVLCPDPVGFYYGGPFYDISMTQPYPLRWKDFVNSGYRQIGAWAFFKAGSNVLPSDPEQLQLWSKLNQEGRM